VVEVPLAVEKKLEQLSPLTFQALEVVVVASLCFGQGVRLLVASPSVVFDRDEVSSVAGSPPFHEASGTATAGPQGPRS
jgi:hypothetical protein